VVSRNVSASEVMAKVFPPEEEMSGEREASVER
jgi:hypothetical protein